MEKQLVENVSPHSCEISRNAKGDYSLCVKAYGDSTLAVVEKMKAGE